MLNGSGWLVIGPEPDRPNLELAQTVHNWHVTVLSGFEAVTG